MSARLNLAIKFIFHLSLFLCSGLFLVFLPVQAATSPDAIAVRVMPNTEHSSPLTWYYNNVNIKGAPQALIVDGYDAVRDGRTVYVGAANIVPGAEADGSQDTLYTNIYIISFNQDAENGTRDIFGQLLQYWKFNSELVDKTGPGICQPKSREPCDAAKGCGDGKFVDHSCEDDGSGNFTCVKKCLLSSECPYGQYCDSAKAKLVRDVKRMVDLGDIKIVLEQYKYKNKKYPGLPSGSYLPNKTMSVWPSWNETLGKALGGKLPQDPVNKLQNCPANCDPVTCWDEAAKKYAWDKDANQTVADFVNPVFPEGSLAFAYTFDAKANTYKLCANFETSYRGLPLDLGCQPGQVSTPKAGQVTITLGAFKSKEGSFRDYFAVASDYQIDWTSLELLPTPSWSDWSSRGWDWSDWSYWGERGWRRWANGGNSLKVEDIKGFDNQKALVADNVNLTNNKDYDFFDLRITIKDIHGNSGMAEGTIKICNPTDCQAAGAECGRLPDGCGGILLCPECPDKQECVANKCVTL